MAGSSSLCVDSQFTIHLQIRSCLLTWPLAEIEDLSGEQIPLLLKEVQRWLILRLDESGYDFYALTMQLLLSGGYEARP